jgi:hypothetical protein
MQIFLIEAKAHSSEKSIVWQAQLATLKLATPPDIAWIDLG